MWSDRGSKQALAAALGSLDCEDGVTLSVEQALEEGRYTSDDTEYGHYKTVYGVKGIQFRPARLSLA